MAKPKKKIQWFEVKDPVFKSRVTFVVNCSIEEFHAWIKPSLHQDEPLFNPAEEPSTNGLTLHPRNKDGKQCHAIWLEHLSYDSNHLAILAHELVHLIIAICQFRGVEITRENTEATAYLYEFYFYAVLSQLNKQKRHAHRTPAKI